MESNEAIIKEMAETDLIVPQSDLKIKTFAEVHLANLKKEMGIFQFIELGKTINWENYSQCFARKVWMNFTPKEMYNMSPQNEKKMDKDNSDLVQRLMAEHANTLNSMTHKDNLDNLRESMQKDYHKESKQLTGDYEGKLKQLKKSQREEKKRHNDVVKRQVELHEEDSGNLKNRIEAMHQEIIGLNAALAKSKHDKVEERDRHVDNIHELGKSHTENLMAAVAAAVAVAIKANNAKHEAWVLEQSTAEDEWFNMVKEKLGAETTNKASDAPSMNVTPMEETKQMLAPRETKALAPIEIQKKRKSVQMNLTRLLELDKILFINGTTNIIEASLPLVDKIAKVLCDNPTIEVRVEGHVQLSNKARKSQKKREYAQKLSEKRARSVMEKLVVKGVNPDRLTSEGFGGSRPLGNGQNDKRVELKVIGLPSNEGDRNDEDVPPPAPASEQVLPPAPQPLPAAAVKRTKSKQQQVDVQENLVDVLQGQTTTWTYIVNNSGVFAHPGDRVTQSNATGEVESATPGEKNTTMLVVKSSEEQQFDTERSLLVAGTTILAKELVAVSSVTVANCINFKPNTTIIVVECKYIVGKIAHILIANPEIRVRIDGHVKMSQRARADPQKVDQSIRLSKERADHVVKELEFLGVDGSRMTARGFGGTRPLPKGQNDKRVEISVVGLNDKRE